jgi:hypothetical protein
VRRLHGEPSVLQIWLVICPVRRSLMFRYLPLLVSLHVVIRLTHMLWFSLRAPHAI